MRKSGLLIVDKEAGFTSFDVVAKLRGMLKIKKIGHSGTLDPDATGVLLILIGKATKALPYLGNHDKTYLATLCLGKTTDTYDATGTFTSVSDMIVSEPQISETILRFIGKQKQIPPMYSAKKVNGKKLYELARAGVEIERKPCDIEIYDISIMEISYPRVQISVRCSEGTYIRSLIHDIGQELGCGAYMERLRRTEASGYGIEDSHTLGQIQSYCDTDRMDEILLPLDGMFPYRKFLCSAHCDVLLNNGNAVLKRNVTDCDAAEDELIRMYRSDGVFAGLYRVTGELCKPEKNFLEEP